MDGLCLFALKAFAAIFVIVDPLGNIAAFVAATGGLSEKQKKLVAWRASVIAAAVLLAFALSGTGILKLFQISFPALRIGGGLVLLVVALHILSGRQFAWTEENGTSANADTTRSGIVPLAIPLMAGPGAMTTVLVLVEKAESKNEIMMVLLSIIVVCALGALCYRFSVPLIKKFGRTVLVTLSCLAGLLLATIAVQFILDGLAEAFPILKETIK
jgi:multiple antibiotic resistance protein